jgi:hypothetical protein
VPADQPAVGEIDGCAKWGEVEGDGSGSGGCTVDSDGVCSRPGKGGRPLLMGDWGW